MTTSTHSNALETDLPTIIKQIATIRQINDFCFSGDDRELFFASNLGEYFRIWSIPSGGGYPREVTLLDVGDVKAMELSPDGSRIGFVVDYDGSENMDLLVTSSSGGRPVILTEKLKMSMPSFAWSPDSRHVAVLCEANHHYNVVVIDSETGTNRWVTNTDEVKMDLDWSPDGKLISYTSFLEPLISHISAVELKTGQIRQLSRMLEGENSVGRFCPAGNTIGFTSNARGMNNVVLMNLESESAIWMPQDNCEQEFLCWNKRGNHFAFLRNQRGESTIHESNYPPTTSRRLTTTGFSGTHVRYGNATDQVAIKLMTPTRPPELFIRRHKTLRKLTECMPHGLTADQFTAPREVSFKSFDDREIPAFYYTPQGITNYPVLMWLHGGPTGQHMNGWNPFIQLFVRAGIGVMAPNVRGSSGYGREFENINYHDWGGGDLQDVIAGVEFIRSDPGADSGKIVVGGASYGGYLTMMAVTRHPDIWAGGINLMGPINLETFYRNSSNWIKPVLNNKYGFKPPEEDPTYYYNRSPINFVDQVQCPLLIMYGKTDSRVPINEMYQLRKSLYDGGKVFEEEILDREGHTMNRSDSRVKYYARIIAFIQKHIQGQLDNH